MSGLCILWDDAYIWGILAVRAARGMGLSPRLARGADIAGGLLRDDPPALLLVPGGNARHKAGALGPAGQEAVRAYVRAGGQYLGFCGGAGLALSWAGGGLGLCPWTRAGFDDRMQHFMSGHLRMHADKGHPLTPASPGPAGGEPGRAPVLPALPVWWPGRFQPQPGNGVAVLASYDRPAEDFWLADLPIAQLPADIFSAWESLYGLTLTPEYLAGEPCIIHGRQGLGGYVLSYSHLETPDSPDANAWLAHLFRIQAGLAPDREVLPPWRPEEEAVLWNDPDLAKVEERLREVLATGLLHGLLFRRNDWLIGWRAGIPGVNLNNLLAAVRAVRTHEPLPAARRLWDERRCGALAAAGLFARGCTEYLLAERLAMTLAKSSPETVPPAFLREQRDALFGPRMQAGGVYRQLIDILDELTFLQFSAA